MTLLGRKGPKSDSPVLGISGYRHVQGGLGDPPPQEHTRPVPTLSGWKTGLDVSGGAGCHLVPKMQRVQP